MARRKKEPQSVHRKHIAEAAEQLFFEKGIEQTSMSEIAAKAGYSKATLYVYFKNKEELIGVLVLESMQKLYDYIEQAIAQNNSTKERYQAIAWSLVKYQSEYPLYFQMALDNINIDFSTTDFLPEEKETFQVGERINTLLTKFIEEGMERGEIRSDLDVLPTIFSFWGMMVGLIQLAEKKEAYLNQEIKKTKTEFLSDGFALFYRAIEVR
ncbi:MAG: TetR/AcrR family transcriptional regulator [Lachnospiraceae bacterium]